MIRTNRWSTKRASSTGTKDFMVDSSPTSNPAELPDEANLIFRVKYQNDRQALSTIIGFYRDFVYRIVFNQCKSKAEVEDIVQETFIALLDGLQNYDSSIANLRTWLAGIAIRKCRHRFRTNFRRKRYELAYQHIDKNKELGNSVSLEQEESIDLVKRELHILPDRFRLPLTLRYLENLSVKEIAFCRQVHEKSVIRNIRLGLETLRKRLAKFGVTAGLAILPQIIAKNATQVSTPNTLAQQLDHWAESVSFSNPVQSDNSLQESSATAVGTKFNAMIFIVSVGTAAIAATIFSLGSSQYAIKTATQTSPSPVETITPRKAMEDTRWTFEQGPPQELRIVSGMWTHYPQWGEQSGGMRVHSIYGVQILLPNEISPQDVYHIHLSTDGLTDQGKAFAQAIHANQIRTLPFKYKARDRLFRSRDVMEKGRDLYIIGNYSVEMHGNEIIGILQFSNKKTFNRLSLFLLNMQIREIKLRKLQTAELPQNLMDPDAIWNNLPSEPGLTPAGIFSSLKTYQPKPEKHSYLFQQDPPATFRTLNGPPWKWVPKQGEIPAGMAAAATKPSLIQIPRVPTDRPFVVRGRVRFLSSPTSNGLGFHWSNDNKFFRNSYSSAKPIAWNKNHVYIFEFWACGLYCISQSDGITFRVSKFPKPKSGSQVALYLNHVLVESIQVETIPWNQIRKKFPNPEALAQSLH